MKLFALIFSVAFLSGQYYLYQYQHLFLKTILLGFRTSDTSASAVAVGDVNGDGVKEIVTVGYAK